LDLGEISVFVKQRMTEAQRCHAIFLPLSFTNSNAASGKGVFLIIPFAAIVARSLFKELSKLKNHVSVAAPLDP
jgi:hypothetical protein